MSSVGNGDHQTRLLLKKKYKDMCLYTTQLPIGLRAGTKLHYYYILYDMI